MDAMSETTTLFGPGEARAARSGRAQSRSAQAVAFFSHRAPLDASVNVVCAIGVAILLRATAAHGWLLTWLAVIGIAVGARYACHVAQRRSDEGSHVDRLWSAGFLVCTAISGAAWGALCAAPFDVASASHLTGVLVLIAFVLGAAVHALAPFNAAFPLFFASSVLPWSLRAAYANNPGAFPDRLAGWFGSVGAGTDDPALLSLFFGVGLVFGIVYLSARRNAMTLLRLQQQSMALMQARDAEAHKRAKVEADLKDAEADLQDVDAELREVDQALSHERSEHAKLREEFARRLEEELASHRSVLQEVSDALAVEREQHRQTRAALLVAQEHGVLPDAVDGAGGGVAARFPLPTPADATDLNQVVTPIGSESLLGRIDTLLDFARLGPGELPIATDEFSVRAIVEEARDGVVAYARNRGVDVTIDVAEAVPARIGGDAARVRRIVGGLAEAVIDVCLGGHVHVQVNMDATAESSVVLRFAIGTAQASAESSLFERILSNGAVEAAGAEEPTGGSDARWLGLTLAAGLTRALGGRLWCDPGTEGGITFRVALPFAREAKPSATITSLHAGAPESPRDTGDDSASADGIRARILIAIDDPTDQAELRDLLVSEGYETFVVADGATAVEAVGSGAFDLTVLDTRLPIVDGLEAATRIREIEGPAGRHTPIVAVASHDTEMDRRLCRSAGMDDFVAKPVDRAELTAAVARQLAAARTMMRTAERTSVSWRVS
jgi:CheY-like chemotaxis protein